MQSPHPGSLRRSSALSLVLALLCLAPPAAAAGEAAPPAAAAEEPAAEEAAPLTILLTSEDSVQVVHVRPAGLDMFRYIRADSVEGYVGAHRIRSVRDAAGRDQTREVLMGRRAIGREPAFFRREPGGSLFWPARSKPLRYEESFPVFELGLYARLNEAEESGDANNVLASMDLGALRNVSRALALGGSLHFETDDDRSGLGLAFRARRWLDNTMSVDASAGAILAGEDNRGAFRRPSYYGEVAFNIGDFFQVAGRVESWAYRYRSYTSVDSGLRPEAERETLVHLGGRIGPYPTFLAGFGLLFVAGVAAASR